MDDLERNALDLLDLAYDEATVALKKVYELGGLSPCGAVMVRALGAHDAKLALEWATRDKVKIDENHE